MYYILLSVHALVKWLVLLSLLYAIIRAFHGFRSGAPFTQTDNAVRHWTATIAHIQLLIGTALFLQSPLVKVAFSAGTSTGDASFFAFIHSSMMFAAILLITVGSSLAKRKAKDRGKFRIQLIWFCLALLIMLIAIPWPFSPLAQRPFVRTF